ncbi:MAG: cupin domain-containing protein [Bacteroidota bacterium]
MRPSNRRDFIRKTGLFSSLCLGGINITYSKSIFLRKSTAAIVRENEGDVWYIGNKRKAQVNIKISKRAGCNPEMSLLSEKIAAGDAIPVHKHLNEEEFIFIQKGEVEITLDNFIETGKAGDLIYVPRATWHGFKNSSKEEVIILFGYTPSGFEDYFRAIGTKEIDKNLGFTSEDWIRTNKKFGVIYKD